MFDLNDIDLIKQGIEDTEDYTGEFFTVYALSGSSGGGAALTSRSLSYNTDELKGNVRRMSAKEISQSGGIYKQDDIIINCEGTFSSDAKIVWRSGTYEVLEKQAPVSIGEIDVRQRTVLRRA